MENRMDAQNTQEATESQMDMEKVEEIKDQLTRALDETRDIVMGGEFDLVHPMKSRGEEIKTLAFDFERITAKEALRVLDRHMGDNAMTYTEEQKIAIFALACRGQEMNGGLDEVDVLEQIEGEDAITAAFLGQRYLAYVNARMNRIIQEAEKGSSLLEGTMMLDKPLARQSDKGDVVEEVKELKYNFRRLRGMKYVECMAATNRTKGAISYGAGLALFAEAVRTNQPIENKEMEKLPAEDAIVAGLIGMGFFLQSRSGVSDHIRRKRRT